MRRRTCSAPGFQLEMGAWRQKGRARSVRRGGVVEFGRLARLFLIRLMRLEITASTVVKPWRLRRAGPVGVGAAGPACKIGSVARHCRLGSGTHASQETRRDGQGGTLERAQVESARWAVSFVLTVGREAAGGTESRDRVGAVTLARWAA
jgi:hypothetical protein